MKMHEVTVYPGNCLLLEHYLYIYAHWYVDNRWTAWSQYNHLNNKIKGYYPIQYNPKNYPLNDKDFLKCFENRRKWW